ncbi:MULTISPECIES: LysE family translocator [Rhodanobacter]|uniref:Lysine exporter protein LysE/YggA n=2 Tax=Rhodanobacter TaxID=75309 RepID=I4W606_9GAMM|nr:LysE family translocator [Rhodanobacter spathiphylli]EIL94897.1 lysine exporter protein LysE/YggA [Rhodanobacter spathiphylli B39]
MSHYEQLWLFFALVFGIVVLPGLDMAFVLGSALAGGRRRGFAAVAGIVAGGICHVLMTALGISVLIKLVPGAFNALLLAGALYIAWIGVSLMRSGVSFGLQPDTQPRSRVATFRQGMLTSLLNPKAYLFMLAIFPQFLHPEDGLIWLQALVMWLIIALNQLCVYGGVTLLADRARQWLHGKPAAGTMATRCVGALLVAAAMFTGVEGWRGMQP